MQNDLGLCGIDFVEFASPHPEAIERLLLTFGFSKIRRHKTKNIDLFRQNDIQFLLNKEKVGTAMHFSQAHGPSLSAMAWRFEDPHRAHQLAVERGAKAVVGDLVDAKGSPLLAIEGIGGMLLYFVSKKKGQLQDIELGFEDHPHPILRTPKGFLLIDHLTNNVPQGSMKMWADFYKSIFGFTEVRYFDIRGAKTGLTSYALRSPCGSFCIPINEGTESRSQINEYLEEYKGPGVQHLAFLTDDILMSLDLLKGSPIETLDIDDEYYADIFEKFPQVTEDHTRIRNHNVLVDGDEKGYLLQIFTKNLIGPIFIEIIQRRNHSSFGEGNFGALFRSIERDQQKRGYLNS